MYVKVCSVVRRDDYTMLYLDRPNGYTITPLSLYEIKHNDNNIIVPIANGNNVRALKFIIPKKRDTYWLNKLTERDIIQVGAEPVLSSSFTPTEQDTFLCYGNGVSHFLSYFTNPGFIIPNKLVMETSSINDCFEFPLLHGLMKQNLQINITGKISKAQQDAIRNSKNLSEIVKFAPAIHTLDPAGHLYVSGAAQYILTTLKARNVAYTSLSTCL